MRPPPRSGPGSRRRGSSQDQPAKAAPSAIATAAAYDNAGRARAGYTWLRSGVPVRGTDVRDATLPVTGGTALRARRRGVDLCVRDGVGRRVAADARRGGRSERGPLGDDPVGLGAV